MCKEFGTYLMGRENVSVAVSVLGGRGVTADKVDKNIPMKQQS